MTGVTCVTDPGTTWDPKNSGDRKGRGVRVRRGVSTTPYPSGSTSTRMDRGWSRPEHPRHP